MTESGSIVFDDPEINEVFPPGTLMLEADRLSADEISFEDSGWNLPNPSCPDC